jgi:N-acetylglutamate synthase-like GNAT family acetyltransferase
MPAKPRKIRRRRPPGELTVEQSHDAAAVVSTLDAAGMMVANRTIAQGGCLLTVYLGDEPVGTAAIVTEVDVAMLPLLFVSEKMRRRGVGQYLLSAVREAVHTRGVRTLYATVPQEVRDFFTRMGFAETSPAELAEVTGQPVLEWIKADKATNYRAVRLDLSRYGIIER